VNHARPPFRFEYKPQETALNIDDPDPCHFLSDIDTKKVETLRKAVSDGAYAVRAEDVAPKLMQYMLRNTNLDKTSVKAFTLHLKPQDQLPDHANAPGMSCGRVTNLENSPSASVLSDGSPGGSGPNRGLR
jgi:hypothetical protein